MNDLMKFEGTMTSKDIATFVDKRHDNVVRDIEDEMDKLGEKGKLIFEVSYYKHEGQHKKYKMYKLNIKGVLQLAARYDANVRYQLIEKVFESKSIIQIDASKAKSIPESITRFVNDCLEYSDKHIASVKLYDNYIIYCIKNKLEFSSKYVFLRIFKQSFPQFIYDKNCRVDNKRVRGYKNLKSID